MAVVLADFVNRHDIGMIEIRRGFGFGAKTLHFGRSRQLTRTDHLERHDAIHTYLAGIVHHSHPTFSDFAEQFVIPESAKFGTCGVRTT